MSRSLDPGRIFVIVIAVAIFAAPALRSQQGPPAQQSPAQPAPPQQAAPSAPAVRVTSRLVQVNVIVEEHGQPVSGLTKDDFMLTDGGQAQKIAFFSEHTTSVTATAANTPAPPPDVFTNRVAQQSGVPTSVTVILLDLLNTHSSDAAYARNQVVKFIEALQPGDRVGLYALRDNLYILHEFTSDSEALIAALGKYKAGESHNVGASEYSDADTGDDLMDAFLNMGSQHLSDFYTINRVELTAGALEAIGNHLATFPGRKNLVWVSSSFPFEIGYDAPGGDITSEHRTFSAEIEDAARALNNANVAIYPVDARALVSGGGGPVPMPQASTLARQGATKRYATASPPVATLETMDVIADRTGGKAFYNTNDIKGAIRRAIDDSRVTYTLAYYPTNNEWNGKFREIKVQLLHHGGELRYRKGYFAFADTAPNANQEKKILADVSTSPLEDTEFGLTIKVDPVTSGPAAGSAAAANASAPASSSAPGNAPAANSAVAAAEAPPTQPGTIAARKVATRLKFDTSQMKFEQKDGRYIDKLVIYWVQVGADAKSVQTTMQNVDLNLVPENLEKVRTAGLVLNNTIDLRPECTTLRVVAQDQGSGAIGSLNVSLRKIYPSLLAPSPAQVPPVR